MQENQKVQYQSEEIELIDLVRIIWKRRKFIVGVTLLLTAFGAGLAFLLPKVYEVSAILEPGTRPITNEKGQIVDEKKVEAPEAVKESILGGAFDEAIREKLNIPADQYPKFHVSIPKNTSLVKISVESSKPDMARSAVKEVVAMVTEGIQEKLEIEKNQVANEMKLARIEEEGLAEKVSLLEKQIGETREKIRVLWEDRQKSLARNPSDGMSVLLYSNEIQNQQIYLNTLQEKLRDLQTEANGSSIRMENLQLKMSSIKSTRLAKAPGVSPKPIRPKKLLIVGLTFVLGLIGATTIAFFLEYLANNRSMEEECQLDDGAPLASEGQKI